MRNFDSWYSKYRVEVNTVLADRLSSAKSETVSVVERIMTSHRFSSYAVGLFVFIILILAFCVRPYVSLFWVLVIAAGAFVFGFFAWVAWGSLAETIGEYVFYEYRLPLILKEHLVSDESKEFKAAFFKHCEEIDDFSDYWKYSSFSSYYERAYNELRDRDIRVK